MPYFTYDTSVIISKSLVIYTDKASNFVMSSVVLLELMASANDDSRRKPLERLFRDYAHDNSLIVPNEDDWLLASKVLYWLAQNRRRVSGGRLPRLAPGVSQRLALDALIATRARRWKAEVVTDNWNDFAAIRRFCNVKIVKASEFFK
jgi:predicted nucleic acid-binding protein